MSRRRAASDVFSAIADPTRRRMLELLRQRQLPASQIGAKFRMSQPSISEHLRILRDAGLVRAQRIGRQRVYRLRPRPLRGVVDWVALFDQFWEDKLGTLGEFLQRQLDDPNNTSQRGS
jgi:DNA-binding transcriptional ArsR family regulator